MSAFIHTADLVALAPGEPFTDTRILLVLRKWDPFAGYWALPGGHVDDGELPVDAAAREGTEETGLIVTRTQLVHVVRFDAPGRDPRGDYATDAFLVELDQAVPVVGADDATEAQWLSLAEVRAGAYPLAFDHDQIIEQALRLE